MHTERISSNVLGCTSSQLLAVAAFVDSYRDIILICRRLETQAGFFSRFCLTQRRNKKSSENTHPPSETSYRTLHKARHVFVPAVSTLRSYLLMRQKVGGDRHWFSEMIPSFCESIDYNNMMACHVVAPKSLKGTSNTGTTLSLAFYVLKFPQSPWSFLQDQTQEMGFFFFFFSFSVHMRMQLHWSIILWCCAL